MSELYTSFSYLPCKFMELLLLVKRVTQSMLFRSFAFHDELSQLQYHTVALQEMNFPFWIYPYHCFRNIEHYDFTLASSTIKNCRCNVATTSCHLYFVLLLLWYTLVSSLTETSRSIGSIFTAYLTSTTNLFICLMNENIISTVSL